MVFLVFSVGYHLKVETEYIMAQKREKRRNEWMNISSLKA